MKDIVVRSEDSSIATPPDASAEKIRRLAEQTARLLEESRAENTERSYRSYWKQWEAHCASISAVPCPGDPTVLAAWIADLTSSGKTIATVYVAISAVRSRHQARGAPSPTEDPIVKEVLRGARRVHGRPARPKKALRLGDLRQVIERTGRDEAGLRDAAVLLLGWYGAFRRSELSGLRWSDLDFGDDEGVSVTLRRSKTDQVGKGKTKGIPYQSDPKLCPVRALMRWRQLCELRKQFGPDVPVFQGILRGGILSGRPLSGHAIAIAIKSAVERAGLNPALFAGHSLRRGFATEAARAGRKIEDIQRHLSHSSISTTAGYVEEGSRFGDSNPARGMS